MNKVFSIRLDENTIQKIALIAEEFKISKKAVIEEAIGLLIQRKQEGKQVDALKGSFGTWRRKERPGQIIKQIHKEFNKSIRRHWT